MSELLGSIIGVILHRFSKTDRWQCRPGAGGEYTILDYNLMQKSRRATVLLHT